jgi:hypothetical protein
VTGPIIEVVTEEYQPVSVVENRARRRIEMRPVAVKMLEDITMTLGLQGGWVMTSLEEELPDLPNRRGAVVLIDDRAAVLTEVRHGDSDFPGLLEWHWADGSPIGPTRSELESAETIHHG